MPSPLTLSIGTENINITTGDLTADQTALQSASAFALISDILSAALDKPISSLATDKLDAQLSFTQTFSWQQPVPANNTTVSFSLTPTAGASVTVLKAGEVFHFSDSAKDDDPDNTVTITVPAGQAYVAINLNVSLAVSGSGALTQGAFGVSASLDASATFALANYFIFDQSTSVRDAITQAFGKFVLPLGPNAANSLSPGDFLEYEFFGTLALSASATAGFGGALFGAFGTGDFSTALTSPVGSIVASAAPTVKLDAEFGIAYNQTDAFRMVLSIPDANTARLFITKMDTSKLSVTLTASATVNTVASLQVQNGVPALIDQAAQKLFAGAPAAVQAPLIQDFSTLAKNAAQPLQDFADEANAKAAALLAKLATLTVTASVESDRISENTMLANYDFVRPAAANSWNAAMAGDFRTALQDGGVTLGTGSFIAKSLTRTTTLSFAFFGLKAQTVEQYFKTVTFTYAGDGVFQFRSKIGVMANSNIFGHQKGADLYFLVSASEMISGVVSNQDVQLFFVTRDQNDAAAAAKTALTLSALLAPDDTGVVPALQSALATNPRLPVVVTCKFASSAFSRIQATPYLPSGKPQPTALQVQDRDNYVAFVTAVNTLAASPADQFPAEVSSYGVWAVVNERANGNTVADRKNIGNLVNLSQVFQPTGIPGSQQQHDIVFLEAARSFMNFCEDLQQLATSLPGVDSDPELAALIKDISRAVTEGGTTFPLTFLKAVLIALVARMGAAPVSVSAPAMADPTMPTFPVEISFA